MKRGRGKREDTSLLEGVGVWTGPGFETRQTPHQRSRLTAHCGTDVTSYTGIINTGEESVEAVLQSVKQNACMHTQVADVARK